jgi:hypothetical protein
MGFFQRVIGQPIDQFQRCALCNGRDPAAYQLGGNYIRELRGNPNRDCVHFDCLFAQQNRLRRFPFAQLLLDDSETMGVLPYISDNEIIFEDTPEARLLAKDADKQGLAFYWGGKQFFIEPKRSEWLKENSTYPRNFLVSLDDRRWYLYMPRNQALLFKLTWGGVLEDARRTA